MNAVEDLNPILLVVTMGPCRLHFRNESLWRISVSHSWLIELWWSLLHSMLQSLGQLLLVEQQHLSVVVVSHVLRNHYEFLALSILLEWDHILCRKRVCRKTLSQRWAAVCVVETIGPRVFSKLVLVKVSLLLLSRVCALLVSNCLVDWHRISTALDWVEIGPLIYVFPRIEREIKTPTSHVLHIVLSGNSVSLILLWIIGKMLADIGYSWKVAGWLEHLCAVDTRGLSHYELRKWVGFLSHQRL